MPRLPLVTLTLSLAVMLAASPARADTIAYTFSGVCADCTGTASASLVLQNYKLGDQIGDTNFVSFTYNGTNLFGPYTVTAADQPALFGSIDPNLPSAETIFVSDDAVQFISSTDGTWCTGMAFGCVFSADYGPTHLWSEASAASAVPEPVTFSLLGGSLLGLVALRRKA